MTEIKKSWLRPTLFFASWGELLLEKAEIEPEESERKKPEAWERLRAFHKAPAMGEGRQGEKMNGHSRTVLGGRSPCGLGDKQNQKMGNQRFPTHIF